MIDLVPITEQIAIMAADWRNANPEACRTPVFSTKDSQRDWFRSLKYKPHKYWAVMAGPQAVGIAGLTHVTDWSGEISLVLNPAKRGHGYGRAAAEALIGQGFDIMELFVIYGETYLCAPSNPFWHHILANYNPRWVRLPNRKLWQGKLYDSDYFSIRRI